MRRFLITSASGHQCVVSADSARDALVALYAVWGPAVVLQDGRLTWEDPRWGSFFGDPETGYTVTEISAKEDYRLADSARRSGVYGGSPAAWAAVQACEDAPGDPWDLRTPGFMLGVKGYRDAYNATDWVEDEVEFIDC